MKPCSFAGRRREFPIPRPAAVALIIFAMLWSRLAFSNDAEEMFVAIRSGDLEKVQALITNNPEVVFTDYMGWAPLNWAAYCAYPNIVEALLEHHAFINAVAHGYTPLHYAASISDDSERKWSRSTSVLSHKEVATLLLSNHAYVDYPDDYGQTPLHLAAKNGLRDVAQVLLASGADINLQDKNGYTALHFAAQHKQADLTELLLTYKPGIDIKDKSGATPLAMASVVGSKEVVKGLLASHAEVNTRDNYGNTPLHYAASYGRIDVAEMLLANGAEVNAMNRNRATPLCEAAFYGNDNNDNVVALLLANKADVNAKCGLGRTPLHEAVLSQHPHVAEILREHGGHE